MDFVLTEHARDAIAKREIRMEWVARVFREPAVREADPFDPELEHRLAPIAEHGHRVLRVIVNTHAEPRRIVTVFFDRRMAGS